MSNTAAPQIGLPNPNTVSDFQNAVLAWYATHRRDLPWRHARDPYAIAVSEVMLQQTQVERAEPKYREFLAHFPTWQMLASTSLGQVLRIWAPLGYNGRAVRLHRLAQWVIANGGKLPEDEASLRALPGIGPYTAAALAAFAFGRKTAVVDTNIRRVIARALLGELYPKPTLDLKIRPIALDLALGVSDGDSPGQESPREWHQALMDLGATVCATQRPACPLCPLSELCLARPALVEAAPPKRIAAESFNGSRRYYRGRFVAALRSLPDGGALPISELGPLLKPDYEPEQAPWLHDLTQRLVADGLVRYDVETESVTLP